MDKARETFDRFFREADVNGDGELEIKELKTILYKIGFKGSDKEIATIFVDLTSAGKDKVTYDDFMTEMCKIPLSQVRDSELRTVFRQFDKDGNGSISRAEMLNCLTEQNLNFTEEEMGKVLDKADKNNDGMIDYEEFLTSLA